MSKDEVARLIEAGNKALAVFDYKGALSKFKKAVKLDKNNAEAHFGYAEAALGVPKVPAEEIIAAYQRAIDLDKNNAYYHARLGAFLIDSGQWDEASKYYEDAARLDPEGAPYYYSEYAIGYYQNWLARRASSASEEDEKAVLKAVLRYLIKSIDLNEEQAVAILKD